MKSIVLIFITAAVCCVTTNISRGQSIKPLFREKVVPHLPKQKLQLYLLVGQSNMAGRGYVEPHDTLTNTRVLRLNKVNEWEIAKDPIHFDKDVAGVGPGLEFGKSMAAANTSVTIGLIPCAVGGSAIENWKAGAYYNATHTYPYDDAIRRAKIAMQSGTLKGIIWHQGESDSSPAKSLAYAQNLQNVIAAFRRDLNAPDLPFIAGELPGYQILRTDASGKQIENANVVAINKAIESLKGSVKNYDYITADGTTDRGDHIHFDAASARLMGVRYAEAMQKFIKTR